MKKILCTVCMRGNSKGIKNKNFVLINGKPLLYHTISKAIKSKIFNEIVVSSDSKKILSLSKKNGIKNLIKRPKNLANDKSGKIPKCFSAKRGVHCVSVKNSTIDTSWKNPKAWYINIKTIPIVVRTVTSAHKNNAFSMIFSFTI